MQQKLMAAKPAGSLGQSVPLILRVVLGGYLFGHPLQDQQLVLKFSKQRVPWQLFSTV